MLRSVRRTPRFKRDYKAAVRKHFDESLFVEAVKALMAEDTQLLTSKYSDHALKGEWQGFRDQQSGFDVFLKPMASLISSILSMRSRPQTQISCLQGWPRYPNLKCSSMKK